MLDGNRSSYWEQGEGGSGTASYRSYAAAGVNPDASLTITKPAGTIDGDMMICFLSADGTLNLTLLSGWTAIDSADANGIKSWSLYKEASSEGADYTWVFSGSNNIAGHIISISKDSGTWAAPTGANLHSIAIASSTSITSSSVTATDNSILLIGSGHDGGDGDITTPPADMTLCSIQDPGDVSQVAYYESRSAGAVTKTVDWGANDALTCGAVVVGLQ